VWVKQHFPGSETGPQSSPFQIMLAKAIVLTALMPNDGYEHERATGFATGKMLLNHTFR